RLAGENGRGVGNRLIITRQFPKRRLVAHVGRAVGVVPATRWPTRSVDHPTGPSAFPYGGPIRRADSVVLVRRAAVRWTGKTLSTLRLPIPLAITRITRRPAQAARPCVRSEEHTSELQSREK